MSKAAFVDTGAWFAGVARNDQNHLSAVKHAKRLARQRSSLVTSNLIVHETTMLLERKVSRKEAIRFLKTINADPQIEIIHADEELERAGYQLYQKYHDQDYSIADCVSFAIMIHYSIKRCFTYDKHFSAMGFEQEPV